MQPFWIYPQFERNAAAALAIGRPAVHLVMPQGLGSGLLLGPVGALPFVVLPQPGQNRHRR